MASQAHAAPITAGNYPDVKSNKMQVTYDGSTKHLLVTSVNTPSVYTIKLTSDSTGWTQSTGSTGKFILNADVNDSTGTPVFSNASLTVGDSVSNAVYFSSTSNPLFTFNPINTTGAVQTLDFLFNVGGGTYGASSQVDVQLHTALESANFNNLFGQSFDNTLNSGLPYYANAFSDTSAVPEPASLSLIALAIPALLRRRKA